MNTYSYTVVATFTVQAFDEKSASRLAYHRLKDAGMSNTLVLDSAKVVPVIDVADTTPTATAPSVNLLHVPPSTSCDDGGGTDSYQKGYDAGVALAKQVDQLRIHAAQARCDAVAAFISEAQA